ncbi:MAG: ComEC/Rec2 family competence protein, partial [Candidatus Sericytochromatia bacterium]
MTAGLYLLAGSWIAGIALQGQLRQLGPLLALAAVASLLLGWRRRKWLLALGCCGLCTAGLLWGSLRSPVAGRLDPARQAPLERVGLSGTVSSDLSQTGPRRWTLDLDVSRLQNHDQALAAKGRVRVHLKADQVPSLRIGDRVRLHGRLALPSVALNFGAFSYRDYLRQQGIFAVVYAQELDKTADGPAWQPQRLLQDLRRGILQGFERRLPLGQARLLGSLLLGSGASPVPDEIQARFQAAGLQHVLAVSGFQVQLVLLGVLAGCQLLRLGRGPSFGLALAALWTFVALTGFPASVLRAGVVASLGLVGYLRFRQLDVLAGLVLGCSGLLLLEPWLLSDIGFQFSVLATAGLVLMSSWLKEKMDWLPLPVSAACAPVLAAQLWVLPAQLWHFGSFSWLF